MSFTIKDRHLKKCLPVSKSYVVANLCYMFLDNEQTMEY